MMEGIIAECGEKDRIGKFVDKICMQSRVTLTDQKRYQLIEDIHEKLDDIIDQKIMVDTIMNKYFPNHYISFDCNNYIRSKL